MWMCKSWRDYWWVRSSEPSPPWTTETRSEAPMGGGLGGGCEAECGWAERIEEEGWPEEEGGEERDQRIELISLSRDTARAHANFSSSPEKSELAPIVLESSPKSSIAARISGVIASWALDSPEKISAMGTSDNVNSLVLLSYAASRNRMNRRARSRWELDNLGTLWMKMTLNLETICR